MQSQEHPATKDGAARKMGTDELRCQAGHASVSLLNYAKFMLRLVPFLPSHFKKGAVPTDWGQLFRWGGDEGGDSHARTRTHAPPVRFCKQRI